MNRQYLHVIIGIVAVVVLAYAFGDARPASTPTTTLPAAGTTKPS
jgi:hypothetical protein